MRKNTVLGLAAAALMSVSVVGFVAAQQDSPTTTQHPYLGVALSDVADGVEVMGIAADSPALAAGLQEGDVITSINGTTIDTPQDARDAITALQVGDDVTLDVLRSGDATTLNATLAAAPADFDTTAPGRFMLQQNGDMAIQFNPATNEWTITTLSETSPLYTAGLRAGDVITAIDGETRTPLDTFQYLAGLADDATVTLTVTRDGASQDVTVAASDLDFLRVGRISMGDMMGQMPFGDDHDFQMPFGNGQQGQMMPFGQGQVRTGVRLGVAFDTSADGATVTEVLDGSVAAEAGLQVGDVITAVNGEVVNEEITLRDRINAYEAGDSVTLTFTRDGASQDVTVTLPEPRDVAGMLPGAMQGMLNQFFEGHQRGQRGMNGMPGMQQQGAPNGQPAQPNSQPDSTEPPTGAANT
ncbi:MAG: PDZ domain-containing protein [Anaerolineae bacterium]